MIKYQHNTHFTIKHKFELYNMLTICLDYININVQNKLIINQIKEFEHVEQSDFFYVV